MVDIISARFASPIDSRIFDFLSDGKSILTIEDHAVSCGFGSAFLEAAAKFFNGSIPQPIMSLGIPDDKFIKHDTRNAQLLEVGLDAESIAKHIRELISQKGSVYHGSE
jgi:1-deoxy-D-xylulose-5-phosphate synthase